MALHLKTVEWVNVTLSDVGKLFCLKTPDTWQNIISTSPRIFCLCSIIRRKYKRPWHQSIFSDTFVFHFCVKSRILLEISSTWCRKIKINSPIKDKFYSPLCTEMGWAVKVRKRFMSCEGTKKIYRSKGAKNIWAVHSSHVRVWKKYMSCEGTKKNIWAVRVRKRYIEVRVQKIYEGTKKIQLTRWQEAGAAALLNTRWL